MTSAQASTILPRASLRPNPFALAARHRKVASLLLVIDALPPEVAPTAAEVAAWPVATWGMVAEIADVNPPSAETVAMVVAAVKERADLAARLSAPRYHAHTVLDATLPRVSCELCTRC